MRQFMMTVMALAVFGAVVVTAKAENQSAPSQAVSAAATCTGLKLACLSITSRKGWCTYLGGSNERGFGRGPYCEKQCNFIWEQCMRTGFWEGALLHRAAERR
jgi:hypothetical protein